MVEDTNVKVAVRVRPLIEREALDGATPCVLADQELACVGLGHDRKFTFDYAFGCSAKQEDVYSACVAPLVESCFEGYNCTVFAYGQTGSGKTHTMGMGSAAPPAGCPQEGIAPRVVRHVFDRIGALCASQPSAQVMVTASFLEIHNEELRDLLAPPNTPPKPLAIRECSDGSLYVAGVREVEAKTAMDLNRLLQVSAGARATSSTLMNDASSRSHVVASITITQHTTMQPSGDGGFETAASGVQMVTKAKLHLVDLAGSERVKRSGVADNQPDITYRGAIGNVPNGALTARFKEAVNINQGLLALGSVISALGDEKKKGSHVPYRDSRLTRLLQDSLGGNSRTAMIACVSSADNSLEESLNTLKWAHRARNISNRPEANRSAEGANKQAALVAMQAEVGMMAVSLARRTAELVPMYAGHGATMLLNQVLSAVDPGSVSSIAACARTLDWLGALQLRLLHNQEDWHGGEQPQTKLYSINQAVMAGSSSRGLRSHPVVNQSMFEDDTASLVGDGTEESSSVGGQSRGADALSLADSDTEGGDSIGRSQVAHLKAALKAARQELCTTVNALKETRDDLERDEMIFADQQRELLALRAELQEARGEKLGQHKGTEVSLLQPRMSGGEVGEDGVSWTTNAAQLANAPTTGRVPLGALGTRGRLGSCRAFSLGQQEDIEANGCNGNNSSLDQTPEKTGHSCVVDRFNWGDLSGGEEGEEERRRRKTEGGEGGGQRNEVEGQLSHQESLPYSLDGSAEAMMAAELAAAAAEKTALEADKAALEAAVQKQQEEFELVRSALESRMATLCASINEQEGIIQELQAEEQRAKEANNALNERLAELEAEIGSREAEVAELRSQVAGMEGSMRESHEARISKTQAQVSMLRRQVVEVEGSRGAERDRQRNASRAASVQAELKAMKTEQEALRRRLADRTAVNERSARQHAQESAALKRAADAARSRISQLEAENRQQRLQLKRKAEEIMVAEKRLQAKTNEHHRMCVSQVQSMRRSATTVPQGNLSPRARLTPSSSSRYPTTPQPTATTLRSSTSSLTASVSARQPPVYQSSARTSLSPRSTLAQQPSSTRLPSPRMPQPQGPFAKPPLTPRSLQHSASARTQPTSQASPRSLTHSQSLAARPGREQPLVYPAHRTVDQTHGVRKDSSLHKPTAIPPSPATPNSRLSRSGTEALTPVSPRATLQAVAVPRATPSFTFENKFDTFEVGSLGIDPELEEWLQQQVHSLAERASRAAKVQRMRARHASIELRRAILRAEQQALAARLRLHGSKEGMPAAEAEAGRQQQRQQLADLDDQMDAAEEELRFLEDELAAAERASQRGDGSAALELRRRIAGLPALSVRAALQGALQVLVECRVRQQQGEEAGGLKHQQKEKQAVQQQQLQQQQKEQQQQGEEAGAVLDEQLERGEERGQSEAVENGNQPGAKGSGAVSAERQQQQQQQQQDVGKLVEQGKDAGCLQNPQSEDHSTHSTGEKLSAGWQGKEGNPQEPQAGEQAQKTNNSEVEHRQQEVQLPEPEQQQQQQQQQQVQQEEQQQQVQQQQEEQQQQQQQGQHSFSSATNKSPFNISSRTFGEAVPGPGNSPAVRASSAALAAAMSGYRSLSRRTSGSSRSSMSRDRDTPPSVSSQAGDAPGRSSEAAGGLSRVPSRGIGSKGTAAFVAAPPLVLGGAEDDEEAAVAVPAPAPRPAVTPRPRPISAKQVVPVASPVPVPSKTLAPSEEEGTAPRYSHESSRGSSTANSSSLQADNSSTDMSYKEAATHPSPCVAERVAA